MTRGKEAAAETAEPTEDHIDEFDKAMERLVAIAENAEFESGTLVGDIRDTLLDVVKNRPKPWSALSEQEQRDLAKAFENVAKAFIHKTVLVVAEQDEISVLGTLKGYSAKGGLFSLKVEARGDEETANQLFRMDGHDVVLMSADSARFTGQKKDAAISPDAPALPFSDEAAEEVDLEEAAEEPTEEESEAQPESEAEPFDAGDEELAGN